MNISIHPFTTADLEVTDQVVMAAYNLPYSRRETLQLYLALQPEGSFVAKHNDRVVGFGGAIEYGPFAYIGLMSVLPSMQKRGIGGRLLESLLAWLETRECPTVLLDASAAGAPLYEHYGFVEDDITAVMQQRQRVSLPDNLTQSVSLLHREDLPALVAFDAPCFGAKRGNLITSYWTDDPQRTFFVRNADGQISGYIIAQARSLGPWVAHTVEAAEQLLVHTLTLPFDGEPSVFVSSNNKEALRLLARYGFSQQRVLRHMRKGKRVQRGRHTKLYGQASLGFG